MKIFDKFRKKREEKMQKKEKKNVKEIRIEKPEPVNYTEEDAMAKKDLKEAVQALERFYKLSGSNTGYHPNYIAGKVDACYALQQYFKGDKDHNLEDLEHLMDYDRTRAGDPFNQGRNEVLSWAICRIHEEEFKKKG